MKPTQPAPNGGPARKPRYCKDCKHIGPIDVDEPICERPRFHMVTGEPIGPIQPQKAFTCRVTFTDCAPWAMYWEPKA